jgi:hypothetical protein
LGEVARVGHYRFFVSRVDGGYARLIEATCDSDAHAMQVAGRLPTATPVDVWEGGRFVGRIELLGGVRLSAAVSDAGEESITRNDDLPPLEEA